MFGLPLAAWGAFFALPAAAQELPQVTVYGNAAQPALSRLTAPLLDTPQTILEVPATTLEAQGAVSLHDAYRYLSDVSPHADEDSSQSDCNTYVRGFSTRYDCYTDGMLTPGFFDQDPFNAERIEFLVGPSGVLFGRGSTGGVTNYVSKLPELAPLTAVTTVFGTDGTKRATADVDRAIAPDAALRINLLGEDSGTGRSGIYDRRFGLAPTLAFGIGTDTRTVLSYFHQNEWNVPDYGVPWVDHADAGNVSRPLVTDSVFNTPGDFADTDVDVMTASIEHDVSDGVTLRDQLRYGRYVRGFQITIPTVAPIVPAGVAPVVTGTRLGLQSLETFLDDQSEAHLRFASGPIAHEAVAGIELGRQTSTPTSYSDPGEETKAVDAQAVDAALYAIDTASWGRWSLTGALRFDRFDARYAQTFGTASSFHSVDAAPSYRAALSYKPAANGSVYFLYGTSFDPSAESLALSPATAPLPPERSETFETGSKWQLGGALLSAALFQTTMLNLREPVPDNPLEDELAGVARVRGVDLQAAGDPLPHWHVMAGYTFLDGVIVSSPNSDAGEPTVNTPRHSAKLWTTYDLSPRLTLGAGVTYVADRFLGVDGNGFTQIAPGYLIGDAMAAWHFAPQLDLQINLKNLTDERYYDGVDNDHVNPGEGRTALLTILWRPGR